MELINTFGHIPSDAGTGGPRPTRRRFLAGTAAVAATTGAAISWGAPTAHATPLVTDFEVLRARWVATQLGSGVDPADPAYAPLVATLSTQSNGAVAKLDPSPTRTSVFTDLVLGTDTAKLYTTTTRLRTMASAYLVPGTAGHGDATLLAQVVAGLQTVLDHAYNTGTVRYGNAHNWQIGVPQAVCDTLVYLHDSIPVTLRQGLCDAVELHSVPEIFGVNVSTGANRVDLCGVAIVRGIANDDSAAIIHGRDAMAPPFVYVTARDGFHSDGGFVQHNTVPYIGGYGLALLKNVVKLLPLLAGTPWEFSGTVRDTVSEFVDRGLIPSIHDGQLFWNVCGRYVAVHTTSEHAMGHLALEYVLRLARGATPEQAGRWRATVKGWLARDTSDNPILDGRDPSDAIPRVSYVKEVLADATIPAAAAPTDAVVFPSMARAIHRQAAWAASVSMSSKRIVHYEWGGSTGENRHGWFQGSGMTYLYTSDAQHYTDAYWPTIDPYRLPGTTADTKPLAVGAGGAYGAAVAANHHAGGARLAELASVGHHLTGLLSPLQARKSWFFVPGGVVALGAGITGSSGYRVETTIENRNLHATGTAVLTVDGVDQPGTQGWETENSGTGWFHLADHAGYVMLGGAATVRFKREERTGSYADIRVGGPATPITRRWVTAWLDHGVDPIDAGYAYLLLPGATASGTATAAVDPGVVVVANTAALQAIRVPSIRVLLANVFSSASFAACGLVITAGQPCAIVARRVAATLELAISDPTHQLDQVVVEIDHLTATVSGGDATATAQVVGTATVVTVDTSARDGRTHRIDLG